MKYHLMCVFVCVCQQEEAAGGGRNQRAVAESDHHRKFLPSAMLIGLVLTQGVSRCVIILGIFDLLWLRILSPTFYNLRHS